MMRNLRKTIDTGLYNNNNEIIRVYYLVIPLCDRNDIMEAGRGRCAATGITVTIRLACK